MPNESRGAHAQFSIGEAPREQRGFLPLVMAAFGAGRALYGAIEANQAKQRQKGYINAAFRNAQGQMQLRQAAGTESQEESLTSRGLGTPGATSAAPGAAPHTVGAQESSDLAHQYGLERSDLDQQHTIALNENKANYANALVGSVANGVNDAVTGYNAVSEAQSIPKTGSVTPSPSPSVNPSLSGGSGLIQNAFGVHATDPWGLASGGGNPGAQVSHGQSNVDFNLG